MKKIYSLVILFSFLLMTAHAAFINKNLLNNFSNVSRIDSVKKSTKSISKITDTRPGKPSELKSFKYNITPYKPNIKTIPAGSQQSAKASGSSPDLKVLSNVKIFPNPVADNLNLSYHVTKDSNVTIKIMDVLGNEIQTLLSQKLSAGEQMNSFPISSSFNSGYYFIRLIVGNETIIKRISIL